jgi:DNA polymerase III alpha subunit (gram-positive type)
VPFPAAAAQAAADVQAALARVGDLPLICYNPTFVRYMLERSMKRMQMPAPDWQWLDLGNMLEGAFGKEMGQVASLETWHRRLGVAMVRRHDAVSDVYAMAQMYAMLTSQCEEQGWRTLDELMHAREGRLWLRGD